MPTPLRQRRNRAATASDVALKAVAFPPRPRRQSCQGPEPRRERQRHPAAMPELSGALRWGSKPVTRGRARRRRRRCAAGRAAGRRSKDGSRGSWPWGRRARLFGWHVAMRHTAPHAEGALAVGVRAPGGAEVGRCGDESPRKSSNSPANAVSRFSRKAFGGGFGRWRTHRSAMLAVKDEEMRV